MSIPHEVRPRRVRKCNTSADTIRHKELGSSELAFLLSPFDLKRLESYANNMLDYHVILDLMPTVASLFFEKRFGPDVHLSDVQSSILLALGAQRKTIEEVEVQRRVLHFLAEVILLTHDWQFTDRDTIPSLTSTCIVRQSDTKTFKGLT